MPNTPSIKNEDVYRALRRQGYSKESAARISNAAAKRRKMSLRRKAAGSMPSSGAPHGPGGMLGQMALADEEKAANYSARVGQVIAGRLTRGTGGRFASAGSGTASTSKPAGQTAPKIAATPRRAAAGKRRGGRGRAAAKPKATPEQRAAEREAKRTAEQQANRQAVTDALAKAGASISGANLTAVLAAAAGGTIDPKAGADLEKSGYAVKNPDGSYRLSPEGERLAQAADRGDTRAALDADGKAQERAAKLAAAEKPKGGGGGGGAAKPTEAEKLQAAQAKKDQLARDTAEHVGLSSQDVDALRQAAEAGGAESEALDKLGFTADGQATDQGRRALTALERGDVRGYQAAVQDAAARTGRETARAAAASERVAAQTRREQARAAAQAKREQSAAERTAAAEQRRRERASELEKRRAERQAERASRPIRQKAFRRRMRMETKAAGNPGDYLVVEDPKKSSTWHLQVKRNGKPDHHLMGAAWAALHPPGYRGNVYQGPGKTEALAKLKALYASEKMELPTSEKAASPDVAAAAAHLKQAIAIHQQHMAHPDVTPTPESSAEEMQHIQAALAALGMGVQKAADTAFDLPSSSLFVWKQADGRYRWLLVSSTAYEDRDGEWVSKAALEADCARADRDKDYGPLLWWHTPVQLGHCDYNVVEGPLLYESGTFISDQIGTAVQKAAGSLGGSLGFKRLPWEPGPDRTYTFTRKVERSLLPHARAANTFTALTVKETQMDAIKLKELAGLLGLSEADTQAMIEKQLTQTKAAADAAGIVEKAAGDMAGMDMASSAPPAGDTADGSPEAPADDGSMFNDAEKNDIQQLCYQACSQACQEMASQIMGAMGLEQKVAEHVTKLMAPYQAKKDDTEAQEKARVNALETELKETKERLATLEGDQPASFHRASLDPSNTLLGAALKGLVTKQAAGDQSGDPLDAIADSILGFTGSQNGSAHN
jgi:hypothetical protein